MAIRSKDEILASLKSIMGEDADDNNLALLEDISDTIDNYENTVADTTDWKSKYEQNDADWRQRYKDRFFSREIEDEEFKDEEPEAVKVTFDSLFTVN